MKTHQLTMLTFTWVATIAFGCARTEPAKTELIERAAAATPVLTATAVEAPTAPVPDPTEAAPEERATPIVEPEDSAKRDEDSFAPEVTSVDGLSLVRFVTATAIEGREPVRSSSTFSPAEERVYAFVEAANYSEAPKTIEVYFIGPRDEVGGGVELEIPASSPRWRTWAYTRHAKAPGLWRVEIRDEDGTLVGALPFEVEAR